MLPSAPVTGSPPRAWGRLGLVIPLLPQHRFTPTRVGTLSAADPPPAGPSVHPHARGDDAVTGQLIRRFDGSPPRAWGRWLPVGSRGGARRFTPTRVGTIGDPAWRRGLSPVHPHAR